MSYAYDALGRRTGVTRNPSGTSTTETAVFNGASRLTQLVQNLAGTGDDLTLDFTDALSSRRDALATREGPS